MLGYLIAAAVGGLAVYGLTRAGKADRRGVDGGADATVGHSSGSGSGDRDSTGDSASDGGGGGD